MRFLLKFLSYLRRIYSPNLSGLSPRRCWDFHNFDSGWHIGLIDRGMMKTRRTVGWTRSSRRSRLDFDHLFAWTLLNMLNNPWGVGNLNTRRRGVWSWSGWAGNDHDLSGSSGWVGLDGMNFNGLCTATAGGPRTLDWPQLLDQLVGLSLRQNGGSAGPRLGPGESLDGDRHRVGHDFSSPILVTNYRSILRILNSAADATTVDSVWSDSATRFQKHKFVKLMENVCCWSRK